MHGSMDEWMDGWLAARSRHGMAWHGISRHGQCTVQKHIGLGSLSSVLTPLITPPVHDALTFFLLYEYHYPPSLA